MTHPLRRIRRGALVLGMILVGAVVAYRYLGDDRDWLSALYMVVITVATVGYGERTTLSPLEQWLTIGVIVFGISAAAYTFGGMIQMMVEGEVERLLGQRRQTREMKSLKAHVVVCGFGRMGRLLAEELRRHDLPLIVIDQDPQHALEAREMGFLSLVGDATEEAVLDAAGVNRARTLVTALPNDAVNVFITLTARELHPELQIIARGEQASSQKKLIQAGADRVVLPAAIGAVRIAAMIARPATLELLELVTDRASLDVELDELRLPDGCPLVGRNVAETEVRKQHNLLIVAVKQRDGHMLFNPPAEYQLRADDVVIALGRREDIERFRREHQTS